MRYVRRTEQTHRSVRGEEEVFYFLTTGFNEISLKQYVNWFETKYYVDPRRHVGNYGGINQSDVYHCWNECGSRKHEASMMHWIDAKLMDNQDFKYDCNAWFASEEDADEFEWEFSGWIGKFNLLLKEFQ